MATPATKLALDPALSAPPAPVAIDAVTAPVVTVVTTLPPESSTLMTGCWAKTTPEAVDVLGWSRRPAARRARGDRDARRRRRREGAVAEGQRVRTGECVEREATEGGDTRDGDLVDGVTETPPVVILTESRSRRRTRRRCRRRLQPSRRAAWASGAPLAAVADGWVVMTNCVATPALTAIAVEIAVVNVPSLNVNV